MVDFEIKEMQETDSHAQQIANKYGADNNSPIRELVETCVTLLENGESPLLLGDRGLGKSTVAYDVAKDLGREVFYFNCSQADAASLVFPKLVRRSDGTVVQDRENGIVVNRDLITQPEGIELVTIFGLNGKVVLLDEITNAQDDLHSFLLSFVQDRRIGNTVFDDILIVATGNGTSHSTLANTLPRPLIERFCVLEFPAPSVDDWIAYMLRKHPGVPSYYYGFLKHVSSAMFYSPESNDGDVEDFRQRPSPRSHTKAAKTLSKFPTVQDALNRSNVVFRIMNGFLGKEVASAFITYLQDASNFLTFTEWKQGRMPLTNIQVINLTISAYESLRDSMIQAVSGDSSKEEERQFWEDFDALMGSVYDNYPNMIMFVMDTFSRAFDHPTTLRLHIGNWVTQFPKSNLNRIITEQRERTTALQRRFKREV